MGKKVGLRTTILGLELQLQSSRSCRFWALVNPVLGIRDHLSGARELAPRPPHTRPKYDVTWLTFPDCKDDELFHNGECKKRCAVDEVRVDGAGCLTSKTTKVPLILKVHRIFTIQEVLWMKNALIAANVRRPSASALKAPFAQTMRFASVANASLDSM